MKKFLMWTMVSLFALSLMACAGTMGNGDVKVKCPSCGYEFDVDTSTGN